MASTYSNRLKLELMETGANANTWGNNTNTNLETVDAFSAGYIDIDISANSGGTYTLSSNNADPDAEASNKVLDLHGTLTDNITVALPAVESNYVIYNNTAGAYTLTVDLAGSPGSSVAVTQGEYAYVYSDGTNVKNSLSRLSGDVTIGGTITEESSVALKENIRPLDNLNGLYSINAYKYDKIDGSQKDETGFIAEEVYKHLPELVQLKDGKPESVKYTKMTTYLLEAIKELKTEIDVLKRKK